MTGDRSLREAGGAGSLEEVAPLSTEGLWTPERSEGKGQLPGEEEGCGRAGSRKMELSIQRDEKTRHGRGGKWNISRDQEK